MSTALELLKWGEGLLAPSPDARWDARSLLEHALRKKVAVHALGREIPPEVQDVYSALLQRRAAGEPTQYITQETWFMGLPFYVDERVLIPRQDTETLCEEALLLAKQKGYTNALELCTGSGALAVSLARLGGLRVTATDISADALFVAAMNAKANGAAVTLLEGDLLAALWEGAAFDLIVCNPPYLTDLDMENLQAEVQKEPPLALRGGPDGLGFYRRLAKGAKAHTRKGSSLLMEVGAGQAGAVCAMFGEETKVFCDINGIARVVGVSY